jgi:hypothetical protein
MIARNGIAVNMVASSLVIAGVRIRCAEADALTVAPRRRCSSPARTRRHRHPTSRIGAGIGKFTIAMPWTHCSTY